VSKETDEAAAGHDEQRGQTADSGAAAYGATAQSTPEEAIPTGAETYDDAARGEGSGGETTSGAEGAADAG
jgi:hypothetical protein